MGVLQQAQAHLPKQREHLHGSFGPPAPLAAPVALPGHGQAVKQAGILHCLPLSIADSNAAGSA